MKPGRDLSYKGVQLRDLERRHLYEIVRGLYEADIPTESAIGPTTDLNTRCLYPADVERAFEIYDNPCIGLSLGVSPETEEVAGRPIHYYSTRSGETHCLVQTEDGYVIAGRLLSSTRDSAVVAPF